MAYPFGGHPTLKQYLLWARQAGCEYRTAPSHIRLFSPDEQRSVAINMGMDERLTPTMVDYFDRRLGLESPFPTPSKATP